MRTSSSHLVGRSILALFLCCLILPATSFAFDIEIDIAPNVLNIQSESQVVTIHTDIAYSVVVGASIFLNGVLIDHWKADNLGNFVAKFISNDIKTLDGLIIGGYNTLVLTGYTTDGGAFIGQQDIKVIDVLPTGNK